MSETNQKNQYRQKQKKKSPLTLLVAESIFTMILAPRTDKGFCMNVFVSDSDKVGGGKNEVVAVASSLVGHLWVGQGHELFLYVNTVI